MTDDSVREVWSEAELDTALRALRSDVDSDVARFASAREELLAAAGGPPVERLAEPSPPRRSWWMASAAVVLVVGIVLVAQYVRIGGNHTPAGAAEQLELAADNVRDEPVGPGQYRYVASHGWTLFAVVSNGAMESAARGEQIMKLWVPRDRRDDWMARGVPCRNTTTLPSGDPIDPAKQESCMPEPYEKVGPCGIFADGIDPEAACTVRGNWLSPNQKFLDSLPRDPDALRARLLADYETVLNRNPTPLSDAPPWQRIFLYAGKVLTSGLAPADLRAAVYRVLAGIDGIEVTDHDASLDGRRGVAFGRVDDSGVRHELVVDPSTGEFIGTRTVYLRTDELVPAGSEFHTSVSTAVVDELGQEPR